MTATQNFFIRFDFCNNKDTKKIKMVLFIAGNCTNYCPILRFFTILTVGNSDE